MMPETDVLMDEFFEDNVYDSELGDGWQTVDVGEDEDEDAEEYLKSVIADVLKHLPGKHDQKTHGRLGESSLLDYQLVETATPAQKRKFAEQIKKKYKSDKRFKTLCDTLSMYTQGTFDPFIGAANAIASGKFEEWAKYEAERRDNNEDEYVAGKGFLSMYGGMGVNRNIFGEDTHGAIYVKEAVDGATLIMDEIAKSPLTDKEIYRGDRYRKHIIEEILEGKSGEWIKRETKRVNEYRQGEIDELKTATKASDKKYIQESIDRYDRELRELHRGAKQQKQIAKTLTVGEEFDVALLSFSHKREVGVGFALGGIKGSKNKIDYRSEKAILYTIVGKHNGLSISLFSPYRQSEILTGGRFKVKKVTDDYGMIHVELEQVGRYDTSKTS